MPTNKPPHIIDILYELLPNKPHLHYITTKSKPNNCTINIHTYQNNTYTYIATITSNYQQITIKTWFTNQTTHIPLANPEIKQHLEQLITEISQPIPDPTPPFQSGHREPITTRPDQHQ